MIFVIFLCALFLVSAGSIYHRKSAMRRLYKCDWNELCRQLEPIPKMTVAQIGDEYLNPRSNQLGPEPVDIWLELGGLEGLHRMRQNARILIALAAYAENWNFTESVIVKERMRQDARHLRNAAFQITARLLLQAGKVRLAFHLQESVASYHLMTKRLLMLYQTSHSGLYPRLVQALGDGSPPQEFVPSQG